MPRISLSEKLAKRKINLMVLRDELVYFLTNPTLIYYLEMAFNDFPFATNFFSAEEWVNNIVENTKDDVCEESYIDEVSGYPRRYLSDTLLLESYLTLVEASYIVAHFVFTRMQSLPSDLDISIKNMDRVTKYNLEKLDYKIIIIDKNIGEFKVVKKDVLAEKVANMDINKNIKWRILDFHHFKNTLEDKEKILIELYPVFEKNRKKINNEYANLFADILNNCVRHKEKNETYNFYMNDKEKWLNYLYDLFLEMFIKLENKKIIKEYKIEKEKIYNIKL